MRRVTNPRESTHLTRESSCKRSGAYIGALSLGWHVRRSQSACLALSVMAAQVRASEVRSWHFIHPLLLQYALPWQGNIVYYTFKELSCIQQRARDTTVKPHLHSYVWPHASNHTFIVTLWRLLYAVESPPYRKCIPPCTIYLQSSARGK